uniref:Zinc finger protein 226 n=1 Tax=Culex pipiens TaxID=7175 RepID=A0A8D8DXV7_CULPI
MDVCRVCLLEDADVFLSVFSKLEQVPIAEMLSQLTGLQLAKGDGLPRFICKECSEDVLKCYKVRRKCLESERQLRSTLEKSREKMKLVEQYLKKEMLKGSESENKNVAGESLVLAEEVLKDVAGSEQLMSMLCPAQPVEKQESFKTIDETEESVTAEEELHSTTSSAITIKREADFVVSLDPVSELIVHTQPDADADLELDADTVETKACESMVSIEVVQEEEAETVIENDAVEAAVETEEYDFGEEYLETQEEDDIQYTIDSDIGEEEVVMMVQKLVSSAEQKQQQDQNGKIICCGCEMHFETDEQLQRHSIAEHEKMRIKSNAKPFECQICFKRFLSEQRLTLHQTYAYREKSHVCEKCTARFTCRGSLLNHMKTHAERTYKCDVCSKCFYTSSTLQSHRLLHSDSKQFKCPEPNCGKSFLRKSDLHIHLVSHSDERPFVCEVCESRFKSKAHLVHHGKVHTREKPYKCAKCDKAFGTYSARNVHQLAHEGIHKYKCEYCDKVYQRNTKLQVHIRRNHTGERPFACDVCPNERFYQNWELTNHKKKVHWMDVKGEADRDDGDECSSSPEVKVKRAKTAKD